MNTKKFRKSIDSTSSVAKDWFLRQTIEKTKKDWEARNALEDQGNGAVYAFFDENERCLYVGQTTQKLKVRALAQTSKHRDAVWWGEFSTLRFINIADRTDQLVLEMLLIIALEPQYNVKPAAKKISRMFV